MATEKLISVDAVIRKLEDEIISRPTVDPEDSYFIAFKKRVIPKLLQNVIDYLKNQPTVDAVEVVHGEWNTIEDDYFGMVALECSVCDAKWWFEDDVSFGKYHYCPYCGAKMDGERNK